jgi:HAD superfamily hydrolase (TIGR01509 family)
MHDDLSPRGAKGLLFDWDGTLADSQAANYRAMAAALAAVQIDLEQEWFDARTGLSSTEMIMTLVGERFRGLSRTVSELVAERDSHFLRVAQTVRAHPCVQAVVDHAAGRIPMAIASGSTRPLIEATLAHQPFRDAFELIVTRDDVEQGKPAPDIFLTAAQGLGVAPSDCLVYEDSDEGITAAHAAGMRVIDVRPYR